MKRTFLLAASICIIAVSARAQSTYTPVSCVPNGFRTVSEENALMEQMLAERRKRIEKEEGITYNEEKQQVKMKHEEPQPARKAAPVTAKKK